MEIRTVENFGVIEREEGRGGGRPSSNDVVGGVD